MAEKLTTDPTKQAYGELTDCYHFFNERLFGSELPGVIMTFQRNKRCKGFFSARRFVNGNGEITDEIAMNPTCFMVRPVEAILSTLAHEMAHQWEFHFVPKGRKRSYHSKHWGAKMKEIGLYPSDTGVPGGKETGEKVTHYILPEGKFIMAVREWLETSSGISWFDRFPILEGSEIDLVGLSPSAVERGVQPGAPGDDDLSTGPTGGDDDDQSVDVPAGLQRGDDDTEHATALQCPAPTPRLNTSVITITTPDGQQVDLKQFKIDAPASTTSATNSPQKPKETRMKFICPICRNQAWGKPSLNLICGDCNTEYLDAPTFMALIGNDEAEELAIARSDNAFAD